MSESRYAHALAPGTTIDGYRILDVLGVGGFGITYLAEDAAIGRRVAIKEYLPSELAARRRDGTTVTPLDSSRAESFTFGLARFRDEARTLVAFEHPNIVPVYKYFEANGTAYYAMRYVEGEPLHQMLGRVGTLAEDDLLNLIHPLLDGVEEVHAVGFLHRDVKPSNIFIRRNRQPVLIDFGAARMALGEHSKSLTAVLTPGYAPFEQYHARGKQGPWTDIYSLGATFYRCITARTPPEATIRIDALFQKEADPLVPAAQAATARYDPRLLKAIDKALSVHEADRPQSVAQFRAMMAVREAAPARPSASAWTGGEPDARSDAISTGLEPNAPLPAKDRSSPPVDLRPPPRVVPAPVPVAAAPVEPLQPTQPQAAAAVPRAAQPWLRRRSMRIAAAIVGAAVGAAATTYGMLRWQPGEEGRVAQAAPPAAPPPPREPAKPTKPPEGAAQTPPREPPPVERETPPNPPSKPQGLAEKPATSEAVKRARLLLTEPKLLWKNYYGSGDLQGAALLPNGQIAVANTVLAEKDDRDAGLFWLNARGDRIPGGRQWRRQGHNEVNRLVMVGEGNLTLAGYTTPKGSAITTAWIVRLTGAGQNEWDIVLPDYKRDDTPTVHQAHDVAQLAGERMMIVGQSRQDDSQGDGWAVLLERDGRVKWQSRFGRKNRTEELRRVIPLPDGTFMAAGLVSESGRDWRVWLVHFKDNKDHGKSIFEETIPDNGISRPADIQISGNGAIVAGWTEPPDGREGAVKHWLRKVTLNGKLEWEELSSIRGQPGERTSRVLALDDGGYILILSAGRSAGAKPRIVRIGESGKVDWTKEIEYPGTLRDAVILKDGGLVAVGTSADFKAWAIGLGYQD